MEYVDLKIKLDNLVNHAYRLGYKVETPKLLLEPVFGNKLAYYQHGTNKIVMHDHFVQTADTAEIENTLIHELAHAVAEQNNETDKRIWHGDAWKKINTELGGNAERFHKGGYSKPAFKKMSKKDMYSILPKEDASNWERGTYNQWLLRGYHVIKGQKGQLAVWEFSADEYETAEDGKTSNWGRASAVYFTADQVEANTVKESK